VSSAGGKTAWVADLVAAGCCTALIVSVLLARGSIWEHVNTGDLHALCIPCYQYSARAVHICLCVHADRPQSEGRYPALPATQGAVLAKF
jgi:hypothetical protein